MVRRAPLLAVVLAAACDTGFRPESLIEGLRVLGMRATPADLKPGETARLESLVLDPSRPGEGSTTLWIGCDPDPFNLNRSPCSDPAVLKDPSNFAGADGGLPEGVHVIGLNNLAAYTAPKTVFDALPEGDERRIIGTAGLVLAISVAQEVAPNASNEELQALFDRVRAKEVPSLVALFRIHLSESDERNHNPVFTALRVGDEALKRGARLGVKAGQKVPLDVDVPGDVFEPFTNLTPDGPIETNERILAAWYSSSGRFSEDRTALQEEVKTVFTVPGGTDTTDPVPDSRTGSIWVVLRDTRGGQSWREFGFFVCDDSLPEPVVTAVHAPATPMSPVVVEGTNLDSLLDVLVDDVALKNGAAVTSTRWEAPSPTVAAGSVATFTTKRCTSLEAVTVAP